MGTHYTLLVCGSRDLQLRQQQGVLVDSWLPGLFANLARAQGWRYFLFAMGGMFSLFFLLRFCFPMRESPKWLMSRELLPASRSSRHTADTLGLHYRRKGRRSCSRRPRRRQVQREDVLIDSGGPHRRRRCLRRCETDRHHDSGSHQSQLGKV